MRRWIVIGRTARADGAFSLDDLPSTSGRLDVLLRAARAALLVSHGVRRDTIVYLVLEGGEGAPRTLRLDGRESRFLRPDERSLGNLAQKALRRAEGPAFLPLRFGVSVAAAGLEAVLADLPEGTAFVVLDEAGDDVRDVAWPEGEVAILVGDHQGLDPALRARLPRALPISVGPVSLHADDAIAIAANELDRRRR